VQATEALATSARPWEPRHVHRKSNQRRSRPPCDSERAPARAREGAASYYFAGGFGSFLTAVPPKPGFAVASQTLMFGGQTQRAVLRGRATFGFTSFSIDQVMDKVNAAIKTC
jgi:hypothetical protein